MHDPLDARQLLNFLEIANVRSIRKAAKNLNLTTSAVSHSLKRLEEDLGCRLFDRDTRKISLTYAGQRLMAHADDLLGNLTSVRSLVSEWSEFGQKILRIGATSAACQYIIPVALRELKESFPNVNIQITQGTSYQMVNAVEENKVDIAIYPSRSLALGNNSVPIGTDTLQFIVNPLHPWAQAGKSDLSKINVERVIVPDSQGYTYDLVDEYFRNYNTTLTPFIEISNEEVIKKLVELNIGIGILPKWVVKKEEKAGTLRTFPLGRRQLKRHWIVAHPKNKELNFVESIFTGLAKSVAQSLFIDMLH
ncbi:LysR family transcriptional regulator [Puniceicoccus vermicola]|uniref:LysR family transcriptional regulator n=1 Tax=Puniceicoccus vermicola TaxID=388746 RepID=A0A7X1E6R7_9BACT|nr:LysR family transcriptional regulator [Puniceicoccus vermicola]MBC2604368.1 LysR family transcriptional regulator [Puniceicoccus vermicola]